MKITYTAPNRSHHYPYAEAIYKQNSLHAFVSGFSRFSSKASLPVIGDKLHRYDFYQNLYLASLKFGTRKEVAFFLNKLSNSYLDHASYKFAKDSDAFIYYRTQGYNTTKRIHKEGRNTICVLEEVNTHVDVCYELMKNELLSLGFSNSVESFPDHSLRLKAYEEADLILCPSNFVRRSFISKGFNTNKLIKVNFGFPSVNDRSEKKIDKEKVFRILYVGQLHYRKGLRYAIEAFKKLNYPKKEFVIVGPKTDITGLEKTTIPNDVIFTGPLKGEALNLQYKSASVFVLPSIEEGLALVQGEALSFGLPIIITTNTGGDDLITNGKEGLIVPPCDIMSLANSLQQLTDQPDLLFSMSQAAKDTAQLLGSWDSVAERLIYELKKFK